MSVVEARQVSWREWAMARHAGYAMRRDGACWMLVWVPEKGSCLERVVVGR